MHQASPAVMNSPPQPCAEARTGEGGCALCTAQHGGTPAPGSGVTDPEKLPNQTAAPSLELRELSEAELITGAAEGRSSLSAWAQGQVAEGTHST